MVRVLLAFALFAADAFAAVEVRSLDGAWTIATDPRNTGREQKWSQAAPVAGARPCKVPGVLETTFPGYNGVVWYWKDFDAIPPRPKQRLLLRFHAADYVGGGLDQRSLSGIARGRGDAVHIRYFQARQSGVEPAGRPGA